MKRLLVATGLVGAFLAAQVSSAGATDASPCPTSTTSSGSRVSCPAPTDPNQAAYDQLKTRLGGDVARALAAQQRLRRTLDQFAGIEQSLTAEVAQEEAVVAQLEQQIATLDSEIVDTQERIDVEKQELAVLSRAIYREPDSFWLLLARTGLLFECRVDAGVARDVGLDATGVHRRT